MTEPRRNGLGARLRAFWRGPLWWLVPVALLVLPTLVVVLAARLGDAGAVPFVYNNF